MGRPDMFTPQRAKAALAALKVGVPRPFVAQICGVTAECFYNWEKRGRRDIVAGVDSKYAKFVLEAKRVEAVAIQERLKTIIKASTKSWQSAAWWLERLHSQYFSKAPDIQVTATANANATSGALSGMSFSPQLLKELQELDSLSDRELEAMAAADDTLLLPEEIEAVCKVVTPVLPTPTEVVKEEVEGVIVDAKRARKSKDALEAIAMKILKSGVPPEKLHTIMGISKANALKILVTIGGRRAR